MRLNFTILLLGVLLALTFEGIYRFSLKTLEREAQNLKTVKSAKNVEIVLYRKKEKVWLIKGQKLDWSKPSEVIIDKFFGKNFPKSLEVSSGEALLNTSQGLIKLVGNVRFKKLTKPVEELITNKAFVSLRTGKIFGTDKVTLKRGKATFVGLGFIYDPKKERFRILRDVQTYIGSY